VGGELHIAVASFSLCERMEGFVIKILEEMDRVLKGSGRLYIIDYEKEKGSIYVGG